MTDNVSAQVLCFLLEENGVLLSEIVRRLGISHRVINVKSMIVDAADDALFPMINSSHPIHKLYAKYDVSRIYSKGVRWRNVQVPLIIHESTFY